MKVLSIIPARGDSKGIPLKNLVKINGKPLLYYSIKASLESKLINRTIVSTDNKKIAETAKWLGSEIIKRPKKLSGDTIRIEPVIDHVLEYLKKNENYVPDIIVLLQNTSPLRKSKHIDEAIKLLKKGKYDSIISGYKSHSFSWKIENNLAKPINYNPKNRPNRQEIKSFFIENGAIYVTKYSLFKKSKCRISGKIGFYNMLEELSYQIDSPTDLLIVEQLMKKMKKNLEE